jgi:hypothetical protein
LGIRLSPKFAVDLKLALSNSFIAVESRYLSGDCSLTRGFLPLGVDGPHPSARPYLRNLKLDATVLHGCLHALR